jgi:hypothetical protein
MTSKNIYFLDIYRELNTVRNVLIISLLIVAKPCHRPSLCLDLDLSSSTSNTGPCCCPMMSCHRHCQLRAAR